MLLSFLFKIRYFHKDMAGDSFKSLLCSLTHLAWVLPNHGPQMCVYKVYITVFFPPQVSCKVSQFIHLYLMGCNYFWMLCEGIYLHTLVVVAVFAEKQHLMWYYFLGWGKCYYAYLRIHLLKKLLKDAEFLCNKNILMINHF